MHEHEEQTPVQGMHCELKGSGTVKCTVTMSDVCLTIYSTVNLFEFGKDMVVKRLKRISTMVDHPVDMAMLQSDLNDLLDITDVVQKSQMSLRSGDKIITYALGQPDYDERDGYLYLTPKVKEWWDHPNIQPVVESIQRQLPDFKPWLLQSDPYIAILSQKSSLL